MRLIALITTILALAPAAARAEEQTGEQIYKQMCVRCHGKVGEGTKKAPRSLTGDKSIAQLADVIDRTMPEDDPDALDAVGSKKVAEYIFDKFYSPAAQARIQPPRVELSHLTVRQYRNAVADVIGSFRTSAKMDAKHGLRGEYFNARGFQNNKRGIDRIDPEVQFDFGTVGPESAKEKFDPNIFTIRWEGAVLAPETGVYEFVVRTDHAARLWVNNSKQALIDVWVKSGTDTEYRSSVFLIAGRYYPIKLEFTKSKTGVDDSKKNPNPPPKPAFVSLLWKRPGRAVELIPARALSPIRTPEVVAIETAFPPDDRSLGWERGTGISKEWDAATTDAALEAAGYIVVRLPELAGASDGSPDRVKKLRDFCGRFTERAFRRPLTDDEKHIFIDRQFETSPDPELAVKRVILLTLKSPRFLYPGAGRASESYTIASRLALALWDSLPDAELLEAAAVGKLTDRAEVTKQAERMLSDPRTKVKIRDFLLTWLKVDQSPELAKDAKRFPGFDPALAADLRTSLELFLDEIVWSDSSDFRNLLLADEIPLNGRLAKFYGVDLPADSGFTNVKFEPDYRSGALTHPYILSVLAYHAESSPIHRGVFAARGLLGLNIRPPQEAFTPIAVEDHPNLTTRERVSLQTKPMACAGCHGIMNPLGFALENFDAVGRYREKENGKPIDNTGSYQTREGTTAKFAGAKELAKFLVESPEVSLAFTEKLFQHMVKQPVRAYGANRPEELQKSFSQNDYNVRKLVVELVVTAATAKPPN